MSAQTSQPPAPQADLEAIARLIDRGQLAPAEQQLRRILAAGGGPAARDLLGVVLSKQGRAEEAEKEYRQALAANPALLGARQHLALLYLEQQRESEAVAELRKAASLGPLERALGLKLAATEMAEGHAVEAERLLRSVADRFPSAQALLRLARLQAARKDVAGALGSLRRALELAPSSEDALGAYAQLSLATRAPVPAARALEALTRMHPSEAQYHYLLGVAMLQVGDTASAGDALAAAERLEPGRPLTLIALGLSLNNRKLYAEAKPYLLRSVELEPENVEALAALAEAEEGLDELEAAETHARRALARSDGHAAANVVVGMVLMKRESYADARAALEKATATDPSSTKAHYQLSLACARLGDSVAAQRHLGLYQKALKDIAARVAQLRSETGLAGEGKRP